MLNNLLRGVCFIVCLLAVKNYGQTFPTFPTQEPVNNPCRGIGNQKECEDIRGYSCVWEIDTCNLRAPATHVCYMIDSGNALDATQQSNLISALKNHISSFTKNPWVGVVTYDGIFTKVRDVKPMNAGNSPLSDLDSITFSSSNQSVTSSGVGECIRLLESARFDLNPFDIKEFIIAVITRGKTSEPSICGLPAENLCDLCYDSHHVKIDNDGILKAIIKAGDDSVFRNQSSVDCFSHLALGLTDASLTDGSAVINLPLTGARRLADRLQKQ